MELEVKCSSNMVKDLSEFELKLKHRVITEMKMIFCLNKEQVNKNRVLGIYKGWKLGLGF